MGTQRYQTREKEEAVWKKIFEGYILYIPSEEKKTVIERLKKLPGVSKIDSKTRKKLLSSSTDGGYEISPALLRIALGNKKQYRDEFKQSKMFEQEETIVLFYVRGYLDYEKTIDILLNGFSKIVWKTSYDINDKKEREDIENRIKSILDTYLKDADKNDENDENKREMKISKYANKCLKDGIVQTPKLLRKIMEEYFGKKAHYEHPKPLNSLETTIALYVMNILVDKEEMEKLEEMGYDEQEIEDLEDKMSVESIIKVIQEGAKTS